MSFELFHKNFDKKIDKQNRRMESKLHSDGRQTEKKLTLSKSKGETDFKFKDNEMQQLIAKLIEELEIK